jgi:hypothetical protein
MANERRLEKPMFTQWFEVRCFSRDVLPAVLLITEEGAKARLFEMTIRGHRFYELQLSHQNEARAISK